MFAICIACINLGIGTVYGAIEGYYATGILSGMAMDPRTYMTALEAVTKEQVVAAAKALTPHTVFFLKGVQ